MRPVKPWFVYILRCADDTLYTGITTDVARRVREHNAGVALAARYTRSRRPVALAHVEPAASLLGGEQASKKLDRSRKLALCGE
jgi:putative endonuclease